MDASEYVSGPPLQAMGQRIAAAMADRISQSQLARSSGVNQSYISQVYRRAVKKFRIDFFESLDRTLTELGYPDESAPVTVESAVLPPDDSVKADSKSVEKKVETVEGFDDQRDGEVGDFHYLRERVGRVILNPEAERMLAEEAGLSHEEVVGFIEGDDDESVAEAIEGVIDLFEGSEPTTDPSLPLGINARLRQLFAGDEDEGVTQFALASGLTLRQVRRALGGHAVSPADKSAIRQTLDRIDAGQISLDDFSLDDEAGKVESEDIELAPIDSRTVAEEELTAESELDEPADEVSEEAEEDVELRAEESAVDDIPEVDLAAHEPGEEVEIGEAIELLDEEVVVTDDIDLTLAELDDEIEVGPADQALAEEAPAPDVLELAGESAEEVDFEVDRPRGMIGQFGDAVSEIIRENVPSEPSFDEEVDLAEGAVEEEENQSDASVDEPTEESDEEDDDEEPTPLFVYTHGHELSDSAARIIERVAAAIARVDAKHSVRLTVRVKPRDEGGIWLEIHEEGWH